MTLPAPTHSLYFECHITLAAPPKDIVGALRFGAAHRFKLSSFFDQNIGARDAPKQDYIFTSRGRDFHELRQRMDRLLVDLDNLPVEVARHKIESTLLDSKLPVSIGKAGPANDNLVPPSRIERGLSPQPDTIPRQVSPKIIPLRGKFSDWRALLHRILEQPEIEGLVIMTVSPKGYRQAHINITNEQMALASLLFAKDAVASFD